MSIARVETYPVAYTEPNDADSTRHLLLLKLTDTDGYSGWGEAVTFFPEATLACRALLSGLTDVLVGSDPDDPDRIWSVLHDHMWWYGGGGLASFAIAAIDIALWDLRGHRSNQPLAKMLGAARSSLPALISCHAADSNLESMACTMAGWIDETESIGIKVAFGKRGDADLGHDPDRDAHFVRLLRDAIGPAKRIMIDIGATIHWTPPEALSRIQRMNEFDLAWIEEPLGADDPVGYALLMHGTAVPIAYGEREWTPRGIERILRTGTVNIVGIDPGRLEGVTGFMQAAHLSAKAGQQVNAHAFSSAIVTAASIACALASGVSNQFEIKPRRDAMQADLVTEPLRPVGGQVALPKDLPGLGVQVVEEVVHRYLMS